MAPSIPGFDPTLQVKIPVWNDDNIFNFALSFLLYFCLQAKKGAVQDNRTHSISFLNAISEPAYADAITTIMMCITNYVSGLDDGYLPANLCIMGLGTQLHSNARTRAHAVIPWVRWMLGMCVEEWGCGATIQGSTRVTRLADKRAPYRDSRGGRGDSRQGSSCSFVQGSRGNGRTAPPPPMGVLHALIVMMDNINLTLYVMRVVIRVMSRRTAMYSLLPFSSRNTNGIYLMM